MTKKNVWQCFTQYKHYLVVIVVWLLLIFDNVCSINNAIALVARVKLLTSCRGMNNEDMVCLFCVIYYVTPIKLFSSCECCYRKYHTLLFYNHPCE